MSVEFMQSWVDELYELISGDEGGLLTMKGTREREGKTDVAMRCFIASVLYGSGNTEFGEMFGWPVRAEVMTPFEVFARWDELKDDIEAIIGRMTPKEAD